MKLSERERVVFKLLSRRSIASADDILKELSKSKAALNTKRDTHALSVLMKYLSAKVCQEGWIISMIDGGQGVGKPTYSMEKKF